MAQLLKSRTRPPLARPRRWRRTGFFRPIGEALEDRTLLAAAAAVEEYAQVTPSWFARLPAGLSTYTSQMFLGPLSAASGSAGSHGHSSAEDTEWIVRLTPQATRQAGSVYGAEGLLNTQSVTFDVLRGLGLPGQMLVDGGAAADQVRAALAGNPHVAWFEPNSIVTAQAITPSDPDFPSLTGLNSSGQFGATTDADIDAPEAWEVNTGSTAVVVGVIDSGIDYTHPDLYLNIWMNQGEIPAALKQVTPSLDLDGDTRITFYDLNRAAASAHVTDFNDNGYIDAGDLLADPRWTDGVDTDRNSFVDDLIGWNFRSAADEPFAKNDPRDALGHGTHVAGTIGAIGSNNAINTDVQNVAGVVGINWRTSLMALKFLDTSNSGKLTDAAEAINYATLMREEFGEPVKVLNASWGQAGTEPQVLRDQIAAAAQSDILLVAAAGNGNVFGEGINLDRDPFFPASSDLPNVISVAASGPNDELARFSNFGAISVDLAAPGIGVLSTLPGGLYGTENGTSMAAPHVAGVAALIWSELPFATSTEVRQAILGSVDTKDANNDDLFNGVLATDGRLNANKAINSTVFAPRASLVKPPGQENQPLIVTSTAVPYFDVTVNYHDRNGIKVSTIDGGDIIATRQWGPADITKADTTLISGPSSTNGNIDVRVTYRFNAPGGSWDPLDFGGYSLSVVAGQVTNLTGLAVPTDPFGEFSVRITDSSVLYVNSFLDGIDNGSCLSSDPNDACTLRSAIQVANAAAPEPRTIILDEGDFKLSIPPVPALPTINSLNSVQLVSPAVEVNGVAYFAGSDGVNGVELWKSDGTTVGTAMVKNISLGPASSSPSQLVNFNGTLFFSANDGSNGYELWKSDGTGEGTVLVKDIQGNNASSNPKYLTNHDGIMFFRANDGVKGDELWKSDGTTTGTTFVKDINTNATGSGLRSLISAGTTFFFVANNGVNGYELWKSDGTANGTVMVKNINQFINVTGPELLTNVSGSLFFRANDGTNGIELWKSDGTSNGTTMVRDIRATVGSFPNYLTNLNGTVFFRANDGISGYELWKSDGTSTGTIMAKDINPNGSSVLRANFTNVSGTLFFRATEGTNGYELWKSDGTTAGTVLVKDINLGLPGSLPLRLTNVNGMLLFSATDATTGDELWISDGTAPGTLLVDDLRGGTSPGLGNFSNVGGKLFFSADDGVNGDKLHWTTPSPFQSLSNAGCFDLTSLPTDVKSGDLDVLGNITVFGNQAYSTVINAGGLDRALKIHPAGHLSLIRATVTGGEATDGGGILSYGDLHLTLATIEANIATRSGGGIAVWGGQTHISASTIASNFAQRGGGVFACNKSVTEISASAFIKNTADDGGGVKSSLGRVVNLTNTTLSQNSGGAVIGSVIVSNGQSVSPSISADGRFVAFQSDASNLVAGDTNSAQDVFVLDRHTQAIERVSISNSGQQGLLSQSPSISSDGRFVAFHSHATNLVPDDTNGFSDVFVFDRQTRTIDRVSVSDTGVQGNNHSFDPSISSDGRFVAFTSAASNLVHLDNNNTSDVFVFDRQTRTMDRVSVSPAGVEGNSLSAAPSISADGRFVAFESFASNFVPEQSNTDNDIFVVDRQTRSMERVSVSSSGVQDSSKPSISLDGRFVAFQTYSIDPGFQFDETDIFVFDRQTQTRERISVSDTGTKGDDVSFAPAISGDGQFVAFYSFATNLVSGDTNGTDDLFVFDRQSRRIDRASISDIGAQAGFRIPPAMSFDGRFTAFQSPRSNLVPTDSTDVFDVLVYDRQQRRFDAANLPPSVFLESTTVADNLGAVAIGGIVQAHNSLFVSNAPRSVSLKSNGFNVFSGSEVRSLDLKAGDQLVSTLMESIGPLQDNGGSTWTYALLPGSPAMDRADPADFSASDQRGVARPQDADGSLGPRADVGAFEAYEATIRGVAFIDRDGDGKRTADEPGIADQFVYVDINKNGMFDAGEPASESAPANLQSGISQLGSFSITGLVPGTHYISTTEIPSLSRTPEGVQIELVSKAASGAQGNGGGPRATINANGRFVAFDSIASDLVPEDFNDSSDIFVYDRQNNTIERVSVSSTGAEVRGDHKSPSISSDGRFVAFVSTAFDLVPADTNNYPDVFVFDRQTRIVERVSVSSTGQEGNDPFYGIPSISADGRFVAFESRSTNLVPSDTFITDVFVFDRVTHTMERVSVSSTGEPGNDFSETPSISSDGRFVVFRSSATNLVPGVSGGLFVFDRQSRTIESIAPGANPSISSDGRFIAFESTGIAIYDRQSGTTDRVSMANSGQDNLVQGAAPSISADGHFVTFSSFVGAIAPNGRDPLPDVVVFDRRARILERLSVSISGGFANGSSYYPSISSDGKFVAFSSQANNLVDEDSNSEFFYDKFVAKNPLAPTAQAISVEVYAGQVRNVDIGVLPDAGEIRGRCFDDVIGNGASDKSEPGRAGCKVYLDLNANGRLDVNDASTLSATDGSYAFTNLDAEMEYRVGMVELPAGLTVTLPSAKNSGIYNVYLPAGGTITDRDFGLRPINTTGQSQNSEIRGRLYVERPDGSSPAAPPMTVFVDLNDNGVRDEDEPRKSTEADGTYSFDGLGGRAYSVKVVEKVRYRETLPIGNQLTPREHSLEVEGKPEGSPKDVASGDFNGDGFLDLALAISDHNAVSILLNDQSGGFLPAKEISLDPQGRPANQPRGRGAYALVAGKFNDALPNQPDRDDLAVANSFSSNVTILLDFNGSSFASENYISVGSTPLGLARDPGAGKVQSLFVVNNVANPTGNAQNVTVLQNSGTGTFSTSAQVSAGNFPRGVVAGHFDSDQLLDFAVANYGIHSEAAAVADPGDLWVFINQGGGTYQSSLACTVSFGPAAVVSADFNSDQKADLAVANFLTNDITVCRGNGDGTFTNVARLTGGDGPFDLLAADVDNDADADLLVTNATSQKIGILRNQSQNQSFAFDPIAATGTVSLIDVTALTLATGHFDGDQILDIAVASSARNKVIVHQNQLVGGPQRLTLTGLDTVSGVDFAFVEVNLPPTLSPITPVSVVANEDAPPITVNLTGIGPGTDEQDQPLNVSVTTNNPSLIASVDRQYQSPNSTGSIVLTLAPNQFGQASIVVTVTDGGLDRNLMITADNESVSRTFSLTVNPLNDPPTFDPQPAIVAINRNAATQTISLTGLAAGGGETQSLRITATTSTPQWIQNLPAPFLASGATANIIYTTTNTSSSGQITITVTDGGLDNNLNTAGDNLSVSQTIGIVSTNNPPTVSLANVVASLLENSSTVSRVKLANIQVTDDGVGGQVVTLSGSDARFFEVAGTELFLAAGVALDHESKPQYAVTVAVDDPTVGSSPDATTTLSLNITNVNEPPRVTLDGVTTALAENSDLATRLKVADILLADEASDVSGDVLRLSGPDAARFEIANFALYLLAGATLDHESQERFQVTVEVDDPTLGGQVNASVDYVLSIADVNEAPSELFLSNFRISPTADTLSGPVFIGKFVAIDEDRSTSAYAFSLVAGEGDADNGSFQVSGSSLSMKQGGLIASAGSTYSVRARVTDGPFTLEQSFELLVTGAVPINHAPSFTKGPNPQNITDESHAVSLPGWATNISRGPGDSILQIVQFIVTSDNPDLFMVPPAIDTTGRLTFTTRPNKAGTANVSVVAVDDGGTANSGSDTSAAQTFTIQVVKTHPWHNAKRRLDVRGGNAIEPDDFVDAGDVLAIINYINSLGAGPVPASAAIGLPFGFLDTNKDKTVAADDALEIINAINTGQGGEAEPTSDLSNAGKLSEAEWLYLLAADLATLPRRNR